MVVRPRFLPGGAVAVGEREAARIRIYDGSGRHVRDLGGKGPGPGELGELVDFQVGAGDTLLALDANGARLRFTAAGGLVDEVTPSLPRLTDERFNVVPWSALPDGRLLLRANERLFGAPDGDRVQSFGVFVVAPSGAPADTVGFFAAQNVSVKDGMPWTFAPPTPLEFAPAADGTLWIGSGREYRLRRVAAGGAVQAELTGTPDRAPLGPQDLEEMTERLVARGATPNDRRVIREWAEALPRSERAPAFRSFFVDTVGRLWVQQWARSASGESRWTVHDAAGRPLFHVLGPPGLEITDARPGTILGIYLDAFGRERVRVHGLPEM